MGDINTLRAIVLQRDAAYAHEQSEVCMARGFFEGAELWQVYSALDHGRMRARLDTPRGADNG